MMKSAQIFLDKVKQWAEITPDITGMALVGSYARNEAGTGSDIDIILIASQPQNYINETEWIKNFGPVKSYKAENWGLVTSLRIYYENGLEVEFGLTSYEWVKLPLDKGTGRVISDGMRILVDKKELLARAAKAAGHRPMSLS